MDAEGADFAHDPRHRPVLLAEVLAALAPKAGEVIVDGTFGMGGYSRAILATGARVIGIDRDPDAIATGRLLREAEPNLTMVEGRFSDLEAHLDGLGIDQIDGLVLDIGVSSLQLDEAERGFSFRFDGPLDMRMGRTGPSAADIVNTASEAELADIFYYFGEERRSRSLARAICEDRKTTPYSRTSELAGLAERVVGRSRDDIHPATRAFQALRIAVNGELDELADALAAAEARLAPGGRLVIVSFHSLEDRIVKRFFADRSTMSGGSRHAPAADQAVPTFRMVHRGAVEAGQAETRINPRARSAKLRAGIRLDAPARPLDRHMLGVPSIGQHHAKRR